MSASGSTGCSRATGQREVILVLVEGRARIAAAGQDQAEMGDRMDVFEKASPHGLHVADGSDAPAMATTPCTLAVCSAPGRGTHPARGLGPEGIEPLPRGQGANLRHINNIAMEAHKVADSLLVPKGHHPCGAPYGYEIYYLNVMAGPLRKWRFRNDPEHDWNYRRENLQGRSAGLAVAAGLR